MFNEPIEIPGVADTLVRYGERDDPVPSLARGWQADSEKKRWRFIIRSKIVPAASVASALGPVIKKWYGEAAEATSTPQTVLIRCDRPMPGLLEKLSRPEAGIPGTGPFRVAKFEAGHRALLEANEDYPGGRPFVDAVEFTTGSQRSYQLSSEDIWELPVGVSRRLIPDGMRVWTSSPLDLIALHLDNPEPGLRDALSLSIDRAAIVNVLTQRRGEVAWGLLPQWLTGYEFLFSPRTGEAGTPVKGRTIFISVPPSDPLARLIADRVMVNARDAGLTMQIAPAGMNAPVQMMHVRLDCADAARALREISGRNNLGDLSSPEALYRAERAVLEEGRLIPLIHVPQVFGIGPRVRSSAGLPACDLLNALPNFWIAP
jgi:hypothetical protein